MRRVAFTSLLLASCAQGPVGEYLALSDENTRASIGAASSPERNRFAPVVDHHQHLLSPAAAALENGPPLAAVEVPPAIASLLRQRAELTASAAGLAPLFAEDAILLGTGNSGWIKGAQKAAEHISSSFSPGYRLTPATYLERGNVAAVTGYYTRGEGASQRHPGYFSMTLVRSGSGWRIMMETPVFPGPAPLKPVDSAALVQMLDAAGIQRAVVLSNAYYFDGLIPYAGDRYAQVRAENDWTAEQVARFPGRLVAFCSFNPLTDYAVAELERCSGKPEFKGLKLHLGTSGVDIKEPEHVERMRQIFAAANRLKMPVLAHLTATRDYGAAYSEVFLRQILPAAPDIPVVIAHLWGGAGYSDEALAVYADAVASGHPAARNLYFEVAQASMVEGRNEENLRKIASRIRQIGIGRILYGSDGPYGNGMPPRLVWSDFRVKVPLSDEEFRKIASNVAPFMKD